MSIGYLCKVPLKAEGEEIDPPGEDWVRQARPSQDRDHLNEMR
jgi:hypothetical protein